MCPYTTIYVSSFYYVSSYHYICVLILPCVLILLYVVAVYVLTGTKVQILTPEELQREKMCPHTTTYASSSFHVSSYYSTCVLILLCMCPHTTVLVSSYYCECPHPAVHASSYYCISSVLILLHMDPHTTSSWRRPRRRAAAQRRFCVRKM